MSTSFSPQDLGSGLILGVDLGSGSLGTAIVNPKAERIEFLGVRVFPAGFEGDVESGKEESRSATRRQARLARRQTLRRHRRLYKVFHLLQRMGLLPEGQRADVLPKLQRELEARYSESTVLPWFLRARALDQRLEPHELGRALYHLAQRRGFLSNRVGGKEDEEERSRVKGTIKGLQANIRDSGKRTLAEYMVSLDPHRTPLRNKPEWANHYTHRSMFEHEFALIWEAQRRHHPGILTEHRRAKLFDAIFRQRPLKEQSHLIGHCELDPDEQRAPLRTLAAQRFRVLGFVNNLRLRMKDGSECRLSSNQRLVLLDLCEKSEKLTFAAARKALGVEKGLRFSIEDGGEKNVPVNLTATRLRAALGRFWDDLSREQQEDLVEDVGDARRCPTDEDVEACAIRKWGLPEDIAEKLALVRLPDGYARYSLKALRELLPAMENGLTAEEAIRQHSTYALTRKSIEPLPLLPPVKDPSIKRVLGEIRNPAVLRSLTELRKTVNAIIRRYGKPECIRIELARDLKKSKKERQLESSRNRKREELRKIAVDELRKHDPVRFANPRGSDVEKYLLAMEAKWRCPYTGNQYGFVDVFGEHPSVDIEHIIPRSRCLDDSYLNKTLAYRSCNAEKGNRTPREWLFESDHQRYERMIQIVADFDSRFDVRKRKRFSMDLLEPDSLLREFAERQLQETRYASKLACRYLGCLYGGVIDACGKQRVFACAGQVTAKLRRAWDLNRILSGSPEKSREDHRHHAVDALTVALSSPALIQELATASAEADRLFRRKVVLPLPWPGFAEQTQSILDRLQISYRPMRKLSGPLHKDTVYSRPRECQVRSSAAGRTITKEFVHYRVPVTALNSAKDFEDIVDSKVRSAVEEKAAELGGGGTKFLNHWPELVTRRGARVPIRRVRIRKVQSVIAIGQGPAQRFVIPGSNHHAEIVAETDADGRVVRYACYTVSLLEAVERKRQQVPVVQRDHGPGRKFICTLSEGDMLEARRPEDSQCRIWRVHSVRQRGQLELSPSLDARLKKELAEDGLLWSPTVSRLFLSGARKVSVTHLGEVISAND